MAFVFEQEFTVLHFESDAWGNMTPGAALRRVQEISTAQCEAMGLNDEVYEKTNTAFLLSRTSFEIEQMPKVGQKVCLSTKAYGMHRATYQRTTTLYAQNGEKLCEADTRWVLVDLMTKRILRKEPEGIAGFYTEAPEKSAQVMNIPPHEEVQKVADLQARYTMCDGNGHINNTKYVDIVCDYLELEQMKKTLPKKILLLYRAEIEIGQAFSLCSAQAGSGTYFMVEIEGKKHFEAYAEF